MQFPKDIFISYAHIDDESMIESQKGWITEFHRALDIRLAQLLGRRANIWRDPALQGNHIFDQQIVDQFEQVAVMISILTPRYVKSEWCVREANEFYEACNKNIGFSINNQARIFKVIKTPVKVEQHPEKIRNILGYEFYTTDSTTGRLKELLQGFGQQSEKLYWEKLDDLANDISGFLDNLEYVDGSKAGTQNSSNGHAETDKVKIYLAESSYETKEFRDSVRRELQDSGYKVFPDKQLPLVESPLIENVSAYLKDTELSVHVIGENYGIVPEGTHKSIIEIQNEVAAAESGNGSLQRLIWIPEGYKPKEERQQAFIDKLNDGKEGITGADLILSSLEDFKGIMSDKIASIEKEKEKAKQAEKKQAQVPAAAVQAEITKGSGIIYLICDMLDIDEIKPLEDFLFDNGCEVMLPIFEGEESQIREDHIENLKMCDAAIIFFGKANEIWLRSKTRDFLKISGYGRDKPLKVKAIYLAGKTSMAKERFRSNEAEVINGMAEIPTEKLNLLLSNL